MPRRSVRCRTPSTTSTSTRPRKRAAAATPGGDGDMQAADAFAARLGLPVRDRNLLEQALVHSSYLHEHRDAARGHNERLEFLGDAVVSLAISGAIFERHPD